MSSNSEFRNISLPAAAQTLARQQQAQKYQTLPSREIIGPSVSLASPTAQRALVFQEVKRLLAEGYTNPGAAKQLQISRNTVNKYRHLDYYPAKSRPKSQQSTVLPYRDYLAKRWAEEERNFKQLWIEIKQQVFTHNLGCVYRFFASIPKEVETLPLPELEVKNWTPRKVQFLLSKKEGEMNEEEKSFIKVFFHLCPDAALARTMALDFYSIFEKKEADRLPAWIAQVKGSGMAALKNFATGLESGFDAVQAAATYHWSSGQVEGQVNRLKIVKRQMYGREGVDLLRKRVVSYHDAG